MEILWAFQLYLHFLGHEKSWRVQGSCATSIEMPKTRGSFKGGSQWMVHLREDLKGG